MSGPNEWLTAKRDALEAEAEELKERLQEVRAKKEVVEEIIADWRERTGAATNGAATPNVSDKLDEDMTIRDAVRTILRRAGEPLTTREITERSKRMGKELNINSVRWDVNHGSDEGVYEKLPPENGGRAKRYRLTE